jgi:predicted dehydrogenase
MSVGVDAFPPAMSERRTWTIDAANFTNVLSIYGGHFGDLLFHTVGFPLQLTAGHGEPVPERDDPGDGGEGPYASPNEVMVIGTLDGGGLFSMQLEGAQRHRTGLQIDITGTDGVLRITNPRGFENTDDNTVTGMADGAESFTPLPVPAESRWRRPTWTPACKTSPTSMPRTGGTGRTARQKRLTSATPCGCTT